MTSKQRYPLFTVAWVVVTINVILYTMGVLITMLQPEETQKAIRSMFTGREMIKQLIAICYHILFFYFSLNIYNRFIVERRNAWPYIGYSLLVFATTVGYFFLSHYIFPETIKIEGVDQKNRMAIFIFSYAISALFFIAIALLLAYLNNLRGEKKQRKILEEQKLQLEVDKSQANFKFLKSQINPHFLHNTLNFLYAKSLPYSEELSEGILTLSDIMRYALNESTGADDKALLKDEIEHVRNVIKINQLRFSNNLNVSFEVNGVINGAKIIPFLLITIVENAFKHGDLQKPEYPISIQLTVEHDTLYFYCRNRKKSGPKEISTGLGLDNIRNRLDFAYGKNYTLVIKDEADFYTTELTIHKL